MSKKKFINNAFGNRNPELWRYIVKIVFVENEKKNSYFHSSIKEAQLKPQG